MPTWCFKSDYCLYGGLLFNSLRILITIKDYFVFCIQVDVELQYTLYFLNCFQLCMWVWDLPLYYCKLLSL